MLALVVASCSDDGGSPEAFCAALADADGLATTFQGFDPTDPEVALEQLRGARVVLGDLLDDAPDEVRADLQLEVDYTQALIEALEDVPADDPTEAALQVQSVTDAHPGVDTASADLASYAARECTAPPTT